MLRMPWRRSWLPSRPPYRPNQANGYAHGAEAYHIASSYFCLCFCNGYGLLLFSKEGEKTGLALLNLPHASLRDMEFEMVEKAEVRYSCCACTRAF
jgi:hypothetical protein